jgi:hypothetical protein
VTIVTTTLNGLRPRIDRNPIGNLGFSHFSTDALISPLPVGSAQQIDHLHPIWILGMVDVLIDSLVIDGLPWMVYPDPSRDLLRGPSLSQAILHIVPDEVVF